MKIISAVLFFLISTNCYCQHHDDWNWAFDYLLDSIVIHAKKDCKSVTITTIPYHIELVFPKGAKPGTKPEIKWIELKKEEHLPTERITYSWVYLNDSMVRETINGEMYYGVIRGSEIVESDKRGNELIHPWLKVTKRDSFGFTIIEQKWVFKNDSLFQYHKFICDSAGRTIESYQSRHGNFINYQTVKYFGDTARLAKTYLPVQDSSFVSEYRSDGKGRTYYVKNKINVSEWIKPQNNSLLLINETYYCSTINQSRTIKTDSTWEKNYNIYNTNLSSPNSTKSQTVFTYDKNGRLIQALETYSGHKNELFVKYGLKIKLFKQ